MRRFDYSYLKNQAWDNEIVGYLSQIHEQKGKQMLYLRQRYDDVEKLIELAKIQSTESSNEIEGIRTTDTRLRQLMSEKTAPRTRDEKEIAGYRDALNTVHDNFEYIPLTPNYILQLHKIMFSHTDSAFGGSFKNVQNYISATTADGRTYALFTPLAPYETPEAMRELCDAYNFAVGEGNVDPLLIIPCFIHDFLCIHPFIDGNGRMSRLLTTLLLYRCGYEIGKYISLEAKIARSKESYYDVLEASQVGWHEGKDDPTEFIKYLLGTIIAAYRDFEERMELVAASPLDTMRNAVKTRIGKFTKTEIAGLVTSMSSAKTARSKNAAAGDRHIIYERLYRGLNGLLTRSMKRSTTVWLWISLQSSTEQPQPRAGRDRSEAAAHSVMLFYLLSVSSETLRTSMGFVSSQGGQGREPGFGAFSHSAAGMIRSSRLARTIPMSATTRRFIQCPACSVTRPRLT